MPLTPKGQHRIDRPPRHPPRTPSALDTGNLPVEELAALAQREGRRPVPIYHAHRWFARRFSCVFRAILVAHRASPGQDFMERFYGGVDYTGLTVLDPFVGGGTSVVEAARLGASVFGVDIDPVACAITRFELRAADTPDLTPPRRQDYRTRVQFYLWDSLQYEHLTRVIGRHLPAILANQNVNYLAWLFPPEDLMPNPDLATRRSSDRPAAVS